MGGGYEGIIQLCGSVIRDESLVWSESLKIMQWFAWHISFIIILLSTNLSLQVITEQTSSKPKEFDLMPPILRYVNHLS